jgi:hypothetical protein
MRIASGRKREGMAILVNNYCITEKKVIVNVGWHEQKTRSLRLDFLRKRGKTYFPKLIRNYLEIIRSVKKEFRGGHQNNEEIIGNDINHADK